MRRTFISHFTLLFAVSFIVGCGPRLPDGMPRLYPVSIEVTQEGAPLGEAMVTLHSDSPNLARWVPSGVTNASGIAVLMTDGKYKGAPLGTYKVAVVRTSLDPHPEPELVNEQPGSPGAARYQQLETARKAFIYVESPYTSMGTTPLTVEITANQKMYPVDAGKKIKDAIKRN